MRSSKTNLVVIILTIIYFLTCVVCKSLMYSSANKFQKKYSDKIAYVEHGSNMITITTGFGAMSVTSQYNTYFTFYNADGREISGFYPAVQQDFIDLVLMNNLIFDTMEIIGMVALAISVGPLVARVYSIKKFYDNLLISLGFLAYLLFSSTFQLWTDILIGLVVLTGFVLLIINDRHDRSYVPKYY